MLELAEGMHIRRQHLRIAVPDEAIIKRILQLTHLDAIVPLDASIEEAARRIRMGE